MVPLIKFHRPVRSSREIVLPVLSSVPVTFTVPPLRLKLPAARRKDARASRREAATEIERTADIQVAGIRPGPIEINGCPGDFLNRALTAPRSAVERERTAGHIGTNRSLVDEVAAAIGGAGADGAALAMNRDPRTDGERVGAIADARAR